MRMILALERYEFDQFIIKLKHILNEHKAHFSSFCLGDAQRQRYESPQP